MPAGQAPRADQAPPAGQTPPPADQPPPDGQVPHLPARRRLRTTCSLAPGAVLGTATISDFDLIALMNDLGVDCSEHRGLGRLLACSSRTRTLGPPMTPAIALPGSRSTFRPDLAWRPCSAVPLRLRQLTGNCRVSPAATGGLRPGPRLVSSPRSPRSRAARPLPIPKIGLSDDGRPRCLPPEAAAQVALAMQMSQPGASEWVDLAIHLRWRLPATSAALSAGVIDLGRARIIADGTAVLTDDLASAVEDRVLPKAGDQTTGQLRGAVRRAVIAADPDGAEERRKDTERRAKVSLFPDEHGTATLDRVHRYPVCTLPLPWPASRRWPARSSLPAPKAALTCCALTHFSVCCWALCRSSRRRPMDRPTGRHHPMTAR